MIYILKMERAILKFINTPDRSDLITRIFNPCAIEKKITLIKTTQKVWFYRFIKGLLTVY